MNRTARTRRGLGAAAACCTAIALVGACTSAPEEGDGGATETTVRVMVGAQDVTDEMIQEFETANPDINIEIVVYDEARLNTMLSAGDAPDIVAGPAIGSAYYNARDLATDLTPYLESSTVLSEDDLLPVNDGFRWDGTRSGTGPLYGIVKDWSQDNTLWYNTALFDEAGVPHLSETEAVTYDELLDLAKELTVQGDGTTEVFGLGLEWAWSLYGPMSAMVMQQGEQLYNDDLTEIDFTTDAAKRAFAWYVDFAQAGVGPTSLNPLPDGSDYSTFAASRMAITQDGYWFGGNFAGEDALDTVRMAPAPVMGDTRVSVTYGGQGWWIPAQAENKDAAWKVMEYYMAGTPAQDRAASGWGLPSLASLTDLLPQDLPYQQNAFTVAQAELEHSGSIPDSPYVSLTLLNTTIDKYLQQAIQGEISIDEACAAVTADVNQALAQGVDQLG